MNTASTQTWTVQQPHWTIPMIPSDYVFIAILFFLIGVWLWSALVKTGARSSRLIENSVGSKHF